MCRDSFLLSSGGSSGCQCNSGLQPVFLASQNARRGEQNAYVPDLAGVAEMADALDSKSSGRKAVWVRAPPPADSWTLGFDAPGSGTDQSRRTKRDITFQMTIFSTASYEISERYGELSRDRVS